MFLFFINCTLVIIEIITKMELSDGLGQDCRVTGKKFYLKHIHNWVAANEVINKKFLSIFSNISDFQNNWMYSYISIFSK